MLAYTPVFFLIELFKKSSSRVSKSKKLRNSILSIKGIKKVNKLSENKKLSSDKFRIIPLPWWFKTVLYGISFLFIFVSIILISSKGN